MDSSGRSPRFGLIHFSRAYAHVAMVDGAKGCLRLRLRMPSSHVSACSRKVTPLLDCVTTLSKYSWVSTPLAAMISLPLRSRSDAEWLPGPQIVQLLSYSRFRSTSPVTSLH